MQIVKSYLAKIRKWLGLDKAPDTKPAGNPHSTGA